MGELQPEMINVDSIDALPGLGGGGKGLRQGVTGWKDGAASGYKRRGRGTVTDYDTSWLLSFSFSVLIIYSRGQKYGDEHKSKHSRSCNF